MAYRGRSAGCAVLVMALASGVSAFGAEDTGQSATRVKERLPEVVVTGHADGQGRLGSKTRTPLRDIPATVRVVPREAIEVQGASADLDKATRNVSGVTQSSSSNYGFFNNYLIRGLNMNFLRDGVPDGSTINGYARSLVDVEQVEVLKGPGSALYGSGAPGGSVNLVSKQPEPLPAYSLAQMIGSFDTYQTSADATGPFFGNDRVWYRFNANFYTTNGFRGLERETFDLLPTVLWKPESHQVTLDFDYRDIDLVSDTNGIPFQGSSRTQDNPLLGVSREMKYYTPFATTEQQVRRYAISDEWTLDEGFSLRNNVVILDRDLYLLRNAGGTVAANSSVMTGRTLREQTDDVTDYLYQLEPVMNFKTGGVGHTLLTGFEFQFHNVGAFRRTASLPNITNVFNPAIPETSKDSLTFTPTFDRDIDARYVSLYGQDQLELTDQVKVRVGGRYDQFDIRVQSRLNSLTERRQDNVFGGQAGVVYQPITMTSFYAGVATSKQATLSTESTALGKPEGGTQYEIGNRTELLDGRLGINAAWYHVTRKDFLVTVSSVPVPVGEQRTLGVDVDVWGEPVKGWKINTVYAFQDAELVDVPQDAPNPSVNGKQPTGIPEHAASLWTTYEVQEGPLKGFGLGGGVTYRGGVYLNQNNTQRIPSSVVGDLVVFYHYREWLNAQVNFTNIADATYYRNGVNSGALPGDPAAVYGTVRLIF